MHVPTFLFNFFQFFYARYYKRSYDRKLNGILDKNKVKQLLNTVTFERIVAIFISNVLHNYD